MSLTDVFKTNDSPKEDESPDAGAISDLEECALSIASLYDNYQEKLARLKMEERRLKAELVPLKAEVDAAYEALKGASSTMKESMQTASLNEIPMHDRPPIHIKTERGSKKSITKTWLCSKDGVGKQAGESLWARVPRNPDKVKLVIPDKYDDQPSD